MWVQSLDQEDPLEEGMATHSSILAWRSSWTEEPDGLQSIGSQSWTQLGQLSTYPLFTLYSYWVIYLKVSKLFKANKGFHKFLGFG